VRVFTSPDELAGAVGQALGSSEWMPIEQSRVHEFAEATGDHQWIHVDPERAERGPFGAAIAHGYLTLSLLPALVAQIYRVEARAAVNYGLNRVRFPAPVRVGAQIRATSRIVQVTDVQHGVQVVTATTIEIAGGSKPGCVAETISRYFR
jgi:acyl dehydratase